MFWSFCFHYKFHSFTVVVVSSSFLWSIWFDWFFFITEPPVLVKLYSQNEQTKGSDLVLTCNVAKGSKPFRFQWFRNGVELTGSSRSSIETKDIFSLYTLRNIDSNDMGNYSCVVTNEFGFDKLWIQLTVTGLRKNSFIFFLDSMFFWAKMWR